MTETLRLAGAEVTLHSDGLTCSRYWDGRTVKARAQETPEYIARARSLGYGEDIDRMSRDHEITHHVLAHMLRLPHSPTLRGVALNRMWPHWQREEAAILGVQAFAMMAGVDLLDVARRARTLRRDNLNT